MSLVWQRFLSAWAKLSPSPRSACVMYELCCWTLHGGTWLQIYAVSISEIQVNLYWWAHLRCQIAQKWIYYVNLLSFPFVLHLHTSRLAPVLLFQVYCTCIFNCYEKIKLILLLLFSELAPTGAVFVTIWIH